MGNLKVENSTVAKSYYFLVLATLQKAALRQNLKYQLKFTLNFQHVAASKMKKIHVQ